MVGWLRFLGAVLIVIGLIGGSWLMFAPVDQLPYDIGHQLELAQVGYDHWDKALSEHPGNQFMYPRYQAAKSTLEAVNTRVNYMRGFGLAGMISALCLGSVLLGLAKMIELGNYSTLMHEQLTDIRRTLNAMWIEWQEGNRGKNDNEGA